MCQVGVALFSILYLSTFPDFLLVTLSDFCLQDVRLIQLASPDADYSPGDVLMVSPHNALDKVDQFLSLINRELSPDMAIAVKSRDEDVPVPPGLQQPLTLRECATQYWDLSVSYLLSSTSPPSLLLLTLLM